jgi:hypothetical protein
MAIILKANKVNLFVSSVLFVFWYHLPNFLDTPCIYNIAVQEHSLNAECVLPTSEIYVHKINDRVIINEATDHSNNKMFVNIIKKIYHSVHMFVITVSD